MKPSLNTLAVACTNPATRPSLARLLATLKPQPVLLRASSVTLIEPLESRQMLSTIQHPLDTTVTVQGEFHTFTASSSVGSRTFIDNNGNKVSFNIIGAGSGTIFQANSGEILTLDVNDTVQGRSSLFINVNKNGNKGTGLTTIADIDIDSGGLNFFNASKVNLSHHFISEGTVKTLSMGDVDGPIQANITIAGTHSDKISLSFGAMQDVSLRTGASISMFRAQDWQDTNDSTDFLEASSLNILFIGGRNETKSKGHVSQPSLDGDFEADLTLTYVVPIGTPANSPLAKPSANVISISGSSTGDWDLGAHKVNVVRIGDNLSGSWTIDGGLNVLMVQGNTHDFKLSTQQGINVLKMGQVLNSSLDIQGSVNVISVLDWVGGSIKADKINFLSTWGKGAIKGHSPSVSGDFSADLLINNESSTKNSTAIGFIRIKGSVNGDGTFNGVSNADWIIAGGAGHIAIAGNVTNHKTDIRIKADNKGNLGSYTVAGTASNSSLEVDGKSGPVRLVSTNDFQLTVGGGLQGLFAGNLVATSVNVGDSIGSIQVTGWETGSIQASKIGNFFAKSFHGNKFVAAGTGNVSNLDISVYGTDVKPNQLALGPVQIQGRVDSSVWRVAGNVGPVSVGAFMSSVLFAGVNTNTSIFTFPTDADFTLFNGKPPPSRASPSPVPP
jgi:hypothetical protein